jgi:hypothetical protein
MNDPYQVVNIIAGELLRPMQQKANANARAKGA